MMQPQAGPCQIDEHNAEDRRQANELPLSVRRFEKTRGITTDLTNLDLLRTVAVLLVFVDHLTAFMQIRGLGDLGHFGVLLFFVHTALVLMLSMERLHLTGSKLFAVFMVRRIFRIYPLSIFAVLLAIAVHVPSAPWLGGYTWPGWKELISSLLLVQNITQSNSVLCVLWSLPFELQMYLILPLIYVFVRRFPSHWAVLPIWFAGVAIAGLEYFLRSSHVDAEFLLFRYIPCFLMGVIAWQLMATKKRWLPGVLWSATLLTLVLLYRLEDVIRVYGLNWHGLLHGSLRNDRQTWLPASFDLVRDWLFCALTGLAIPFFADISNRSINAITLRIARYSYGVYLSHIPILWLCFSLLHIGNVFASAILAVILTAFASIVLYRTIESPAIQLGKRVSTRMLEANSLA